MHKFTSSTTAIASTIRISPDTYEHKNIVSMHEIFIDNERGDIDEFRKSLYPDPNKNLGKHKTEFLSFKY